MAEKAQEILDGFPSSNDWYVAEKALRWLQEYRDILLEALTLYYKQNNPLPPQSKKISPKDVP